MLSYYRGDNHVGFFAARYRTMIVQPVSIYPASNNSLYSLQSWSIRIALSHHLRSIALAMNVCLFRSLPDMLLLLLA